MKIQISNDFLTATFNTLGAELVSLKTIDSEYIWDGNPQFWNKHAPVLFPIVGALKDDIYFFEGKKYHLPRHGFAREKQFQIVEHTAEKIVFLLKEDAETLEVYPFQFEFKIEYLLVGNALKVHFEVVNTATNPMYFSIGAHPAFALSENFENYAMVFEGSGNFRYSLLEQNLLENQTAILETKNNIKTLDYALFEKDALVFRDRQIHSVVLQENGDDFLKVNFEQFPDLGIWTKKNAPYLCIEPWFGHADEIQTTQNLPEKAGIIKLNQQEIFQANYSIEILAQKSH